MTVVNPCYLPVWRFADNNNNPLNKGQVFIYQAGTTTQLATVYTDSTGTTPTTFPIVCNARGETADVNGNSIGVWIPPGTAYKVVVQDASGNLIWSDDNLFPPIDQPPYPVLGTEGNLVTNNSYPYGDIRRYGALPGVQAGNQQAIQNAFTAQANAGGGSVTVPTGPWSGLSTSVSVSGNTTLTLAAGASLIWTSTTPNSGPLFNGGTQTSPGLWLSGSNITITGQGSIIGPAPLTSTGVSAFNLNWQVGVICVGASITNPNTNIRITGGVTILGWGTDDVTFQFVKGYEVLNNFLLNCGYGAMHALSCVNGKVLGNEMGPIGPGTGSPANAYGVSHTYFPTTTTAGSSRADANPLCTAVEVAFNTVHDSPWSGIDFHGGYECDIHDNKIYNCLMGISCTAGNGNSAGNAYGGYNFNIEYNTINAFQLNGSPTAITTFANAGIFCQGATANSGGLQYGTKIVGNTVDGYGQITAGNNVAFSIGFSGLDGALVSGNKIRNWTGHAIWSGSGGINCSINDNIFDGATAVTGGTSLIYITNGTGISITPFNIEGNKHNIISTGTASPFGATILTSASGITGLRASGNEFASCTTAQYGNGAGAALATSFFLAQSDALTITAPGQLTVGTIAGSAITTKIKGTATFAAGTTVAVSFSNIGASNYQVAIAGSANLTYWVTAKAGTGFTLNASGVTSSSVDWIVEL